ncbi:3TM-type holin [Paremcibacter congregatus]|uniref:3TM-type holin n=1 Tax=Paremcibacter congregatus TaxID=2043170 RepID=UPI0030EC67A4
MSIWSGVKNFIGGAAPLIGTLVGGPAGTLAGGLLSQVLGDDVDVSDPQAVEQALRADPAALAKLKTLEEENRGQLERLAIQADTIALQELHKSYRLELQSQDKFVRWWRPFYGWACGVGIFMLFFAVTFCLIYAVVWAPPDQAGFIMASVGQAISAVTTLTGVALTVLGINITKRSSDKAVKAGSASPGILEGITQLIRGK